MKPLFWPFIFLFLVSCGKDTIGTGQEDRFIKFFGGSGQDAGYDVKVLPSGGYILAGSVMLSPDNTEIAVIETDIYGNETWSAMFGGPGNDACNALQLTSDGGAILLCTFSDTLAGETDLLLIRLKGGKKGEPLWEKRITRSGNQGGASLLVLQDGFVMTGFTDESGTRDILVVRTTEQGDILDNATSWYKFNGYGTINAGNYLISNPVQGGYIVVGTTSLEDPGAGLLGSNILVCRVPENGNNWANEIFGGQGTDEGTCIQHISGGNYVLTGTLDAAQNPTMFALKISIDLVNISQVWNEPVTFAANTGGSTGSALRTLSSGELVFFGSRNVSAGNTDFYLVQTDSNGTVAFEKRYGGTGIESGKSFEIAGTGGFILVGSTGIPEDNNRMIALVKVDDRGEL